jgi:enoyl-CoA hydratase/carnithine racemase
MTKLADYQNRYKDIRFKREDGILEMAIHDNGGPAKWTTGETGLHKCLGDAFWDVAHDRENRVVIFTGTGDAWLQDFGAGIANPTIDPKYWHDVYKEGKDLLHNFLDIECPVIAAINGNAFIHSEIPVMADVVLAADHAKFADKAHWPSYTVPGDGVHTVWPMLLGPNRGRYFLITAEEVDAHEMKRMNVVAEVLPKDKLMARAWEIAREINKRPEMTLRYTRVAFTQNIKKRLLEELGYGLMGEGLGAIHAAAGGK